MSDADCTPGREPRSVAASTVLQCPNLLLQGCAKIRAIKHCESKRYHILLPVTTGNFVKCWLIFTISFSAAAGMDWRFCGDSHRFFGRYRMGMGIEIQFPRQPRLFTARLNSKGFQYTLDPSHGVLFGPVFLVPPFVLKGVCWSILYLQLVGYGLGQRTCGTDSTAGSSM